MLQGLRSSMSKEPTRASDLAQLKGSPAWLTALPFADEEYVLRKRELFDAIYMRYRWLLKRLTSFALVGNLSLWTMPCRAWKVLSIEGMMKSVTFLLLL